MSKTKTTHKTTTLTNSLGLLICCLCLLSFHPAAEYHLFSEPSNIQSTPALSFEYANVTHKVSLISNTTDTPLFYKANITTPVCSDSICEIVHLNIYWDLIGNYLGIDTIKGLALTKFDHVEFTTEDYFKLHHILADKQSDLKHLLLSDLTDNETNLESEVIDAVSGATSIHLAKNVIKGGVYSCYTLWHICDKGHQNIKEHTARELHNGLFEILISSNQEAYELFALNALNTDEYTNHTTELAHLIRKGNTTIIDQIITESPDEFMATNAVQVAISEHFSSLSHSSKHKVLERLATQKNTAIEALENLSTATSSMTTLQTESFIRLLNKNEISETTLLNLKQASEDNNYRYKSEIKAFLCKHQPAN